MRITSYLLMFLLLAVTLLSNCKDEDPCAGQTKHIYYKLSADTAALSYNGFDSILFEIRNSDSTILDTCLFIGSGKKYYIKDFAGGDGPCLQSSKADAFKITYKSATWSDSLVIRYSSNNAGGLIELDYQDFRFGTTAWGVNGKFGFYFPAKIIGGTTYYNIDFSCIQNKISNGCEDYPLLINLQYGILFYRTYGSHIFSRIAQ